MKPAVRRCITCRDGWQARAASSIWRESPRSTPPRYFRKRRDFSPEDGRISFAQRSSDRLPISRDEEPIKHGYWTMVKSGAWNGELRSATAFISR